MPVALDCFNDKDIIKIKNKQKEIFEKEKNFFLKRFVDGFSKRFENSKLKQVFLVREYQQCNRMLTTPVPPEKHHELYPFQHTGDYISGGGLDEYHTYFKAHIINGNEKMYHFINSPHFPFQNEPIKRREIFAQALIEYSEFLNRIIKKRKEAGESKKQEIESFDKIFNSPFEFCKTFEEFHQDLQIDQRILKPLDLLVKLREYKINYSKIDDHFSQFDKDGIPAKMYKKILRKINEDLETLLKTKSNANPKPENEIQGDVKPLTLDLFFADFR